jgi:hypothetical protein
MKNLAMAVAMILGVCGCWNLFAVDVVIKSSEGESAPWVRGVEMPKSVKVARTFRDLVWAPSPAIQLNTEETGFLSFDVYEHLSFHEATALTFSKTQKSNDLYRYSFWIEEKGETGTNELHVSKLDGGEQTYPITSGMVHLDTAEFVVLPE